MKTDSQIQRDVMEELAWDPVLNSAEIGVAVKNGIVTLSGQVDSYFKKLAAEKDARKIVGVRALAEDIQIGVSPLFKKNRLRNCRCGFECIEMAFQRAGRQDQDQSRRWKCAS